MRIISFIRNLFTNKPIVETFIYPDEYQAWYLNGYRHREDRPVNKPKMKLEHIDENGIKYFSHNGEGYHIIYSNGDEYWYLDDYLHREDGPAIVTKTYQAWYKHGKIIREFGLAPKKGK